jgi:hypothetical protein
MLYGNRKPSQSGYRQWKIGESAGKLDWQVIPTNSGHGKAVVAAYRGTVHGHVRPTDVGRRVLTREAAQVFIESTDPTSE